MSDTTKHRRLIHRAVCAGASLAVAGTCAAGGVSPALADVTGTVSTPIYVTPDMAGSTTVEGYGDGQLKVVLPVGLSFRATTDGTLVGPTDGEAKISNNSDCCVRISKIQASSDDGFKLVGGKAEVKAAKDVYIEMAPLGGHAISLGDYAGEGSCPETNTEWEVGANAELGLVGIGGKIGSVSSLNPSGQTRVAAVNWTVSAGSVRDAAAADGRVLVHCVTDAGTLSDITYTEGNQGAALPEGYVWHLGGASGEVVTDVASVCQDLADGVSEVFLFGIAL